MVILLPAGLLPPWHDPFGRPRLDVRAAGSDGGLRLVGAALLGLGVLRLVVGFGDGVGYHAVDVGGGGVLVRWQVDAQRAVRDLAELRLVIERVGASWE